MDRELFTFFTDPKSYGLSEDRAVTHIQTHVSDVFLAGESVYKVKRPVNFGFLDFSTLDKRYTCCVREIEINKRLAGGVYEDVVAVCRSTEGGLYFNQGQGEAVEYAVKMKRLDDSLNLKNRLLNRTFSENHLKELVFELFEFYKLSMLPSKLQQFGLPHIIKRNTDENFEQTLSYVGKTIKPREFSQIESYTNDFLLNRIALINGRVQSGFIRDCHGDLHCEHIYFPKNSNKPIIIDGIEFNDRFRYQDVASDVAFLVMDLEFQGYPDLAREFLKQYILVSKDEDLTELCRFYTVYRAYVRGKVEGFVWSEIDDEEKKALIYNRVRRYFRLAFRKALGLNEPFLLVFFGPMGSGKTTLAKAMSDLLDVQLFSTDEVRKELAGIGKSRHYVPYGEDIYSPAFNEKTYRTLISKGLALLKEGHCAILDGCFARGYERNLVMDSLKKLKLKPFAIFVSCEAPLNELKNRLDKRQDSGEQASNGRLDILGKQMEIFEPVALGFLGSLLRIWTHKPLGKQIENVIKVLSV